MPAGAGPEPLNAAILEERQETQDGDEAAPAVSSFGHPMAPEALPEGLMAKVVRLSARTKPRARTETRGWPATSGPTPGPERSVFRLSTAEEPEPPSAMTTTTAKGKL